MPEPTAPAAAPAWSDVQPVIDEELARLPEKLRVAVVLCDLEGRTQREVAQHLGVPPATLATRLTSARRTLAARLTRRGVTLSGGALAGMLATHASATAVPHALAAGVARAAEAVAAGAPVGALVSAQAVQLSEGVMQMMMLSKLKAVAVIAAVALTLTTGLGVGLVPAAADDRSATADVTVTASATGTDGVTARLKDRMQAEPVADDAMFLRRLSLDVRGTIPTPVETWFFVSDEDAEKRSKVIEWIVDDEDRRAAVAKKLGVPAERIVRVKLSADGRHLSLAEPGGATAKLIDVTFTPDGKHLVAEGGPVTVYDTAHGKPVQLRLQGKADVAAAEAGETGLWSLLRKGDAKSTEFRVWVNSDDTKPGTQLVEGQDKTGQRKYVVQTVYDAADSDAEFLKRALTDVRGAGPTALELKYFTEDKDPKKREKLLDTLLKEPAVQKKLGEEWKKKLLALQAVPGAKNVEFFYFVQPTVITNDKGTLVPHLKVQPQVKPFVVPLPPDAPKPPVPPKVVTVTGVAAPPKPPVPPAPPVAVQGTKVVVVSQPQTEKLEKLVGELLAAQKSDEALLEAVTLVTLSRLPTDAEKKLAQAVVSAAPDRKTAWVAVAKALAGSDAKGGDVLKLKIAPADAPKPAKP